MINFGKDKTISVLSRSMDGSALKQRAISDNIANVNTPGFKRNYVDFESRLQEAITMDERAQGKLRRTHQNHLPIASQIEKIPLEVKKDTGTTMREDGNNVDIDLELAMLAENTIRFNTLSESATKKFAKIRSVIRGGR